MALPGVFGAGCVRDLVRLWHGVTGGPPDSFHDP